MPTSQEDCNCDKQCPGESNCACLWDYERARCVVDCPDVMTFHVDRFLAQDARIAINVRNVELARLGEFLGSLSTDDVLIPATAARDAVDMSMYDTTLGEALREAGLVVRERDDSDAPAVE